MLRRRGQIILLAAAAFLLSGLVVLGAMPTVYSARSAVGPSEGATSSGPVDLLVERVRSPATLAAVASDCEVRGPRTPLEVLAGIAADPVQRLEARVESVHGAIIVEASGTTPEVALEAANLLAQRLVDLDAERRATVQVVSEAQVTTADAPAVPAQVLLAQLRIRYPTLRDPDAERRLQEIASRMSEDRIAVAAMRAQLDGLTAEAERLEGLVREEAARAWRLDRAERQSLAERARSPRSEPESQGRGVAPSTPAGPPPSRVAQLEAELSQLLATRTTLHPDVRRLLRLLESERQRAAVTPAPAPSPPAWRPASRSTAVEDVSMPADSLLFVTDDEDPALPPQQQPGDGPDAWIQRAPSYPAWVEARARGEEVRLQLDAREQERAARQREHDQLTRRLADLEGPRLEEARLLARVDEEARAAARSVAATPLRAPAVAASAPLRLLQAAGVQSERSPWRHFPTWVLCSFLLPLFGGVLLELRDRSVRGLEDLDDLGAPLLGVIPHLRRGR